MTESAAASPAPFACARFIKEIGRGPNGARALSSEDTRALYSAMLEGRVSDVELGAVLLAYRLKGETAAELAAMLEAAHASFELVKVAAGTYRPVSIPSYNGARKQPNLVPLLALLLAREGVPTLVHGVTADAGRVTSAEIFTVLGIEPATTHAQIEAALAERKLAFAPIEVLAPKLARLLALRRIMGVRNSTHTLVKIMQPFSPAGLRLVNYTHPEYRESLAELFAGYPSAAAGGATRARHRRRGGGRYAPAGADRLAARWHGPNARRGGARVARRRACCVARIARGRGDGSVDRSRAGRPRERAADTGAASRCDRKCCAQRIRWRSGAR